MANLCTTEYIFIGSKEDILDFRNTILTELNTHYYNKGLPLPFTLKDIVNSFGIKSEKYPFRGELLSIGEPDSVMYGGEEMYTLYLNTTTAWVPFPEAWDLIIKEKYPDMRYVMCAEEPGFQLYVNTDKSHEFFDIDYRIDITMAPKYYSSSFTVGTYDSLLDTLNSIFGWRCKCFKQFNNKLKRKKARMKKLGKPFYFYLHEYTDIWEYSDLVI